MTMAERTTGRWGAAPLGVRAQCGNRPPMLMLCVIHSGSSALLVTMPSRGRGLGRTNATPCGPRPAFTTIAEDPPLHDEGCTRPTPTGPDAPAPTAVAEEGSRPMHALVITFRSAVAPEELQEDFARYAEALR